MFNKDFYPTPSNLIIEMLSGVDMNTYSMILEPSAGKGDIVEYIQRRYPHKRVHAIELEPELRDVLKGKNVPVVHDDFLTFQSFNRYDLVVMNPPFSNGDEHLLKALSIGSGTQVVSLLNAETLKNPHTARRKDLLRQLEELNASIEYVERTFLNAERSTNVEVAIVKVFVPEKYSGDLLANLEKASKLERARQPNDTEIANSGSIEAIVDMYNFEANSGMKIIDEYNSLLPYLSRETTGNEPILKLSAGSDSSRYNIKNEFIEQLRMKYWRALFQSPKFMQLFAGKQREAYLEKVGELKDFEFNMNNILQIQIDLSGAALQNLDKAIIELFDEFSSQYYDEQSKNIHYYNGWKTNKAWKINKKVITRLDAFGGYSRNLNGYDVQNKIADIEKTLAYLDGNLSTDYSYISETLSSISVNGDTKNIGFKYITASFYKKGTTHIVFKDENLLKKFNIIGAQNKGWLPPSYGSKSYEEANSNEKTIIDEFEGEKSYKETSSNYAYYKPKTIEIFSRMIVG